MAFSDKIQQALREYEQKKGWRFFARARAIKALRSLDSVHQSNSFQLCLCFIKNMPDKSRKSYQVYRAIVRETFSLSTNSTDKQLDQITQGLVILHQSKLLTQSNFDAIKSEPSKFSEVLKGLNAAGLLTQANFNAVIAYPYSGNLFEVLKGLNTVKLLTQSNFNAIKSDPDKFHEILKELKAIGLLTQSNFDAIKSDPGKFHEILKELKAIGLLTQSNFDVIKSDPGKFYEVLKELNAVRLLTQSNFDAIKADLGKFYGLLKELNAVGLLTQSNFDTIKSYPDVFFVALKELNAVKLLTQANFDVIKPYPSTFFVVLRELSAVGLLTQPNFDAIKSYYVPGKFYDVLKALNTVRLLTQSNFDAIKLNPSKFSVLKALNTVGLLTQSNFDAVKSSPGIFFVALRELNDIGLLTQSNFDAIKSNPSGFSEVLKTFNDVGLLTQANFNTVVAYPYLSNLSEVLKGLDAANLLTQANFNLLLENQNNDYSLRRQELACLLCLRRIPPHLMSQTVFNDLVTLARQLNQVVIEAYLDRLLNTNLAPQVGINDLQSTHTASVHRSVSASAAKLWARYKSQLLGDGLAAVITKIKNEIAHLSDSLENKAAKDCIERITAANYDYTDSTSEVTIRQLLALSYLAINDQKECSASLEDAKKQFIRGLYEIQRGYNLSDQDVDDGKKAKPICIAGTFNKLIEKLCGIHSDVNVLFITKETAALKLPIVVREEVGNCLEKKLTTVDYNGPIVLVILANKLKDEGIDVILDEIKPRVAERMFDEFECLYVRRENKHFTDLIDSAQYCEIEDLVSSFRQKIRDLPVYHPCSNQSFSMAFFSVQVPEIRYDNAGAQQILVQA